MSTLSQLVARALLLPGLLGLSSQETLAENKFYVQVNAGAAFAPTFQDKTQSSYACIYSGASPAYRCGNINFAVGEGYDPGYFVGAAVGYRFADQFRVELEGMYQNNNVDRIDITYSGLVNKAVSRKIKGYRERSAFLLNGYYDFTNNTPFTPYVSAGLGGYHIELNHGPLSLGNDLALAWQLGAGVNYRLDERISFDMKYRYFGGEDADFKDRQRIRRLYEVGDHQVVVGVRLSF